MQQVLFRLIALLLSMGVLPSALCAPPPNVVLVVVDDLGATDLGCYGSDLYETPHIDRLAAQGLRFTQAYSACTVCSPTRAAILTGKSPARLHVTDWIAGHKRPKAKLMVPDWTMRLELSEVTIAEALKPAGYASISIGKWHLGEKEFWPEAQGFDQNLGGTHRGQPPSYFSPYRIETLPEGPKGEFLTDREAAEACKFIKANTQRPFFLYLPHHAVHTPLMGKSNVVAKYQAKLRPGMTHSNAVYAALIESVDDSVGRIMDTLRDTGLADRTVVIFTSDNGGLIPVTRNPPFRVGKGSAYEGGVRIPLIVKWPGVTRPGAVNQTPVISMDLFPTILEMAGQKVSGKDLDGQSLVSLMREGKKLDREALYWHYPHYHPGGATPYSAIRDGDWRLLHFYEDDRVELYNLATDPGEKKNVALAETGKAAALKHKLDRWLRSVGAQMPAPNPNYDPMAKSF